MPILRIRAYKNPPGEGWGRLGALPPGVGSFLGVGWVRAQGGAWTPPTAPSARHLAPRRGLPVRRRPAAMARTLTPTHMRVACAERAPTPRDLPASDTRDGLGWR